MRLLALIALVCAAAALAWRPAHPFPTRFGVVEAGQLYRSGEVSPDELAFLRTRYDIRRVISLMNPDAPESRAEREAAARLGIRWENVPLPGDGASTAADRERIMALLRDKSAGPTLVHCAAGTNRSGLAVGLYRLQVQRWPLEQVMRDLESYDFKADARHANMCDALKEAARQ